MKNKNTIKLVTSFFGLSLLLGLIAVPFREDTSKVEAATYSQTVNEYYSNINWDLTGANLKTALFNKIKISTAGWSYDGLWNAYKTTDVRPDGTHFWDIYSDTTNYTLNDKRINASYKKEGDSINREHVIPQSSFKEAAPMKSDVHHVLPSDGYVNNRRSAYPHGIVTGSVKYTSNDGCKLGSGTGNTTVFEPMDNYKGDIARIYFYFVTCYQDKMSNNTFSAFDKSTYPSIQTPYLNVYLQWAKEDPVSEKEIIRNNGAYAGQGNRNPFIDCPYAVGAIWDSAHASDYGNKGEYTSGEGLTISKTSVNMISGGTTSISATSTGSGNITWTSSNSSVVSVNPSSTSSGSSVTLTAGNAGSATITATTTISGKQHSKSCTVTVAATKQVTSIAVSNQKTSYVVDEAFVKPTVIATYNDGTEAEVSASATFTGYDLSVAGEYTVNVSYTYGGITRTASYGIKVKSSGGGGESGEEVTLDIDFTKNKTSDTDKNGNVWEADGDTTPGSGYLRLNSSDTYISNSPALSVDTDEDMTISANLRTYGGVSNQSLRITAYNEDDVAISNTLVLSPKNSSLVQYSGTLTFTSSADHLVTIKAYSGNDKSLGISGMSVAYISWEESPSTLDEIDIDTYPTKMSYLIGETFDPTGLVITRTYSDGKSNTYAYAGHTSEFTFDPSPLTPLQSGDDTVEVIYGGQSCFFEIELTASKVLSSIGVSGQTSNFVEGDAFSFGGTVTAYYEDGSSENVTSSSTFSGYDMTAVGNQTVTVSYSDKSTTYCINIAAGTLSSITVSGQTTTYQKGAGFVFDGVCIATFANGYEKEVTPTSVSAPDMTTTGDKVVTVTYTEDDVTVSTTYTITVNKVLSSIELSGMTTVYTIGDEFSFDGTVTAHYNDGSSAQVTPTSVSTPDMSTAGTKTITVTYSDSYGEKTATYDITIHATLTSIAASGQTTQYTVGDTFNFNGTCTATFDDGSTKVVTPVVSFPDMSSIGTKTVTLTYTEYGTTVTATYNITVSEAPAPTPTPEPTPEKKGCGGSVATTSVIVSALAISLALLLTIASKRKED